MSSSIYNSIRDALALVRKSNVVDATAIIRKALSGDKMQNPDANTQVKRLSLAGSAPTVASVQTPPRTVPLSSFRHKEVGNSAPTKTRHTRAGTGNFTSRIYHHTERDLSYMLYVPTRCSAHAQSLLLMLHGCTQNPNDFAIGTQMNSVADEFNLIVAYPLQPKTANTSGCWNWFDARHQKHGSGEPAMLAALAENLRCEFAISENRVFAAGLSAGGAMVEVLASTYQRQFTAVGVHSGLPYGAATSLRNALGAMKGSSKIEPHLNSEVAGRSRRIVFHGSSDATVHPSNAERIVNQSRRHSRNLTKVEYTNKINGREVTRTIWEDENGAAMVEQWVVRGGGHAWFGGNRQGSYTDPKGPDASREMVRFFLQGRIRETS